MSLKYRDSQGNETPVAGLNGTSGELVPSVSYLQSGVATVAMPNTSSLTDLFIKTVTFDTPFDDTDYVLNVDQCEVSEAEINRVYNKTTTGFTVAVMYNRQRTTVPSYNVTARIPWQAFKLMTDESRALDETHIEQNTTNFAPAFSEVTSYAVGDYVTYNNILYRCTTAHTAGAWVAGHFTQVTVGGDLVQSTTYVEYSPNTSLYSTWEELLELIYQHGNGYWTGTVYIGRWYTYTAKITIGTLGYWYGSFLAKGAEDGDLVGASKIYGATTTWTVTHYATESDLPLVKYLYCDGAVYTSLDALLAVIIASIGQVVPNGGSAGVFNGVWTGKSHFSVQWTCAAFVSASAWSGWFSLTLENAWVDHSIYSISVSQSAIITQRAIV